MHTHEPRPEAYERGVTTTHLLTAVVVLGLAMVALFLLIQPSGTKHDSTPPQPPAAMRPVLRTLQADVHATVHALVLDPDGCAHASGERAVVSFLADGSAPERASWFVETRGGDSVLVRRECRNGALVASSVVAPVTGTPLVSCTPSCGQMHAVRFSYDSGNGLTTIVAYRGAATPK